LKTLSRYFIILLVAGFGMTGTAFADWANSFVVNDGNSYIVSDVQVKPEQIGSRIGKVTRYSDVEGTYSGNFSNKYPKGTEYYKINNVDLKEGIAIKEAENQYVMAYYSGEYAGSANIPKYIWLYAAVFLALAVLIITRIVRKPARR